MTGKKILKTICMTGKNASNTACVWSHSELSAEALILITVESTVHHWFHSVLQT